MSFPALTKSAHLSRTVQRIFLYLDHSPDLPTGFHFSCIRLVLAQGRAANAALGNESVTAGDDKQYLKLRSLCHMWHCYGCHVMLVLSSLQGVTDFEKESEQ